MKKENLCQKNGCHQIKILKSGELTEELGGKNYSQVMHRICGQTYREFGLCTSCGKIFKGGKNE